MSRVISLINKALVLQISRYEYVPICLALLLYEFAKYDNELRESLPTDYKILSPGKATYVSVDYLVHRMDNPLIVSINDAVGSESVSKLSWFNTYMYMYLNSSTKLSLSIIKVLEESSYKDSIKRDPIIKELISNVAKITSSGEKGIPYYYIPAFLYLNTDKFLYIKDLQSHVKYIRSLNSIKIYSGFEVYCGGNTLLGDTNIAVTKNVICNYNYTYTLDRLSKWDTGN